MVCNAVDERECVVEAGCPSLVRGHAPDVLDPGSSRCVRDTRLVADQHDLHAVERLPARECVALDHADVTVERLWDREERQHRRSRNEWMSPPTPTTAAT